MISRNLVLWAFIFTILGGVLYLAQGIMMPFVAAFIFAYILSPQINLLDEILPLSRTMISAITLSVFLALITAIMILITPIIIKQIILLTNSMPAYKKYVMTVLVPNIAEKAALIDENLAANLKSTMQDSVANIFSGAIGIFNNFVNYTVSTLTILSMILLVPMILFYFLRDWHGIIFSVQGLFPLRYKQKINDICIAIDDLLSAYIRGQLNICILIAIYYSLGLLLLGVDFPVLLGVISGFMIILPLIGVVFSLFLSLLTSYFSYGVDVHLLYVFILYCIGYIAEGYILTPGIIGDKIGLHPVWIILAVLFFGSVFGFTGVFFAIPIAGICKILINFVIEVYKESELYRK